MKAYITLLGTNSYFDGVLGLYQSLKDTGAHYPFVVAVTPNISIELREALKALEIEVVEVSSFEYNKSLQKKNIAMGMPHWNGTMGKFSLFGLKQFEKLVYLDCDMLVLHNLDHLFEKPHLAAAPDSPMCSDEPPEIEAHKQLNAGLIVVEPSEKMKEDLINISLTYNVQDQDALRIYCPNWLQREELHLPQEYNVFTSLWERYKKSGMNPEDVMVAHFIGSNKPWMDFMLHSNNAYIQLWTRQYLSSIVRAHNELEKKFDF